MGRKNFFVALFLDGLTINHSPAVCMERRTKDKHIISKAFYVFVQNIDRPILFHFCIHIIMQKSCNLTKWLLTYYELHSKISKVLVFNESWKKQNFSFQPFFILSPKLILFSLEILSIYVSTWIGSPMMYGYWMFFVCHRTGKCFSWQSVQVFGDKN